MSNYPDGTTQAHLDAVNLDPPEEVLCDECNSILTPDGCPLCDKVIQSSCIEEGR